MAAVARPQAEAVAMPWDEFLLWFGDRWRQGDHIDVISPTGTGKTTFVGQLLVLRKYVAVFDSKGGDKTLDKLPYARIRKWPLPDRAYDRMERGEAVRIIVGWKVRKRSEYPRLWALQAQVLDGIWEQEKWTLYLDELQMATDPRMGQRMGGDIEMFLIGARDRGISVVSGHQRTSWSPRSASDQASWIVTSMTGDEDVMTAIARRMGRPVPQIRGAIRALDEHVWLVVSKRPRDPVIVTSPPPLGPR